MAASGEGSFITGKIMHMHLVNFMTYEVINFAPKEYLNVILGPNGTGKSTLVSAILIGMGGDFAKIGRATHLKDYIKHGQEHASIEISLFKNEDRETIKFTRNISTNGRSEYRLNDRKVDQDRYMASVRRFNIQVDNLCQFLPQDRVQDFALMNPHEILRNTQKSVLPPEVTQQFDKLLEYESFAKNVNAKAEALEAQIATEEATNERLKPVVERMQQRNDISTRLNVANMKQKWLQKEQLEAGLQSKREDLSMAERSIKERMAALMPIQEAATNVLKIRTRDQKLIDDNKKRLDMAKVGLRQIQNRSSNTESEMEELSHAFQTKAQEIHARKEEEARLRRDLAKAEKDAAVAEREFGETDAETRSSYESLKSQAMESRRKRHEVLEQRNELCERMDSQLKPKVFAMENRLQSMRNFAGQRLESLRAFDEQLYGAVLWLRQHRDEGEFEGRIYEPMLLELNVKRKEHVAYFENTISRNDLTAFTCENTNDTVTLHRLLNEAGFKCNVLFSPATDRVCHQAQKPFSSIAPLGFHSYLLDLVEGPVPLLNYICKMYGVHNIPVADERAMRNLARIQQELQMPVMFIGNLRMFTKKSMYTSDLVRGTDSIHTKNWLSVGVDESLIAEQEKSLRQLKAELDGMRNRRTQLETQLEYFEAKEGEWKAAEGQLKMRQNQLRQRKAQVTNIRTKLNHVTSLPNSLEQEEEAYNEKLRELMERLLQNGGQQVTKLTDVMKHTQELRLLQKKLIFRERQNSELKRSLENTKVRLDEAKNMYETIKESMSAAEEEIRSHTNQFKQLSQVDSPTARNFRFKGIFNELPSALDTLQEQIVLLRTQVECMNQDDESLYLQYENRRKLLIELREALANHKERKTNVGLDMENLRVKWLPAVEKMVKEVNVNFKRFMALIEVVGEVEFIKNDSNAYSEFGIGIRVKYRDNGPFLILDRYHHSGGERAVAIATYTLALQKISQVPFRCVDEINQGMDPDNERKVFNMLVDEAAQPGRAQYFFVSPKFQPDVKANRYTAFHIIDSGKYLEDTDVFNCSAGVSMMVE